jgi:hypothetical protein
VANVGLRSRANPRHSQHGGGLASRVQIRFRRHRISVSGTLTRWAEKDALLALLRHAQGVRGIDDHLRVKPPD